MHLVVNTAYSFWAASLALQEARSFNEESRFPLRCELTWFQEQPFIGGAAGGSLGVFLVTSPVVPPTALWGLCPSNRMGRNTLASMLGV